MNQLTSYSKAPFSQKGSEYDSAPFCADADAYTVHCESLRNHQNLVQIRNNVVQYFENHMRWSYFYLPAVFFQTLNRLQLQPSDAEQLNSYVRNLECVENPSFRTTSADDPREGKAGRPFVRVVLEVLNKDLPPQRVGTVIEIVFIDNVMTGGQVKAVRYTNQEGEGFKKIELKRDAPYQFLSSVLSLGADKTYWLGPPKNPERHGEMYHRRVENLLAGEAVPYLILEQQPKITEETVKIDKDNGQDIFFKWSPLNDFSVKMMSAESEKSDGKEN